MTSYSEMWEQLKAQKADPLGMLVLQVPREQHKTILNALRKQSLKDRAFRFTCIEENKSFEIGFTQIGDILQIFLRWKDYVTEAFVITPERVAKMQKWREKK